MANVEEKRVPVSLAELTEMVADVAAEAREDGMVEVADALEALAELPEERRAEGIAILVRVGKEFLYMFDRAAASRAGWN